MIYIITILFLVFFIFHYDVMGNTRNKMTVYYLIMGWYIAISGFQYCMGSDIIIYMKEYDEIQWSDISLVSLVGLNNRQLGWVLLIDICKLFSRDFVILKIVQAVFVNTVFFAFFKNQTKYIYTCIFFYSIFLFFDFNFNLLRQSIAVAFFLLSYKFYAEQKWLKYYLYVFGAILFHNSAIILLFVPLLKYLEVTLKSLVLFSIGVLVGLVTIKYLNIADILLGHMSLFMDSEVAQLGNMYLTDEKYGQNTASLISFLIVTVLYFWIIFFDFRNNLFRYAKDFNVFFVYILILILNSSIPIFARFNFYFLPIVIYLQSNFCINLPDLKLNKYRLLATVMIIAVFSYSSISGLFRINTTFDENQIIQFYPYYTVFDKKLSPERENLFGSY